MRYQYDSMVRAVLVPSISLCCSRAAHHPSSSTAKQARSDAHGAGRHTAPRASSSCPAPPSRSCDAAAMALGGVFALARRRSLARLARPRAVATAIAPSRDHDRDDHRHHQRHHHPPRRRARAFVVSPFALEPPPPAPPPATPPRAWSSRGLAASAGAPGPPTATTPGTPGTPAAAAAADAPLPLVIDARSESELEDAVARAARAGTTVVFDFYANWCGPCKVLTPKLEALVRADAAEAKAEAEASPSSNPNPTTPSTGGARPSARPPGAHPLAVLVKVDVDALPGVSDQLRIKSLPTVMLFSRGRFLDQFEGVLPDDALAAYVAKAKALALETRAGGGGPEVRTDVDRTSGDFGDASPSAPPPPPLDAAGEVAAAHEALRAAVAGGALAKAAAAAAAAAAGGGGGASAGEGEASEAARFASAAIARALDPSMHAGPATRAEAYAAAAIIGLLGGGGGGEAGSSASGTDAAGARAAIAAARAEIDGTFPEPDAVTRAGALVELFLEEAEGAAGGGEAAEAAEAEAAEGGARAAASGLLRSARAAALRGDFEAAVADALGAVKKGERERGRAACVRLFEALGHAHPLTVSGRKKLSNVWFL